MEHFCGVLGHVVCWIPQSHCLYYEPAATSQELLKVASAYEIEQELPSVSLYGAIAEGETMYAPLKCILRIP